MILLTLHVMFIAEITGSLQCVRATMDSTSTSGTSSGVSIEAVIGSIFGGLILISLTILVILILVVFLFRKNMKSSNSAMLELWTLENEVCIFKTCILITICYRNTNLKYLLM